MNSRILGVLALLITRPALGWDSIAVQPKGSGGIDFMSGDSPICTEIARRTPEAIEISPFSYCREGLEAARCVFGGEHAQVTSAVYRDLGLVDYLETTELLLPTWAIDVEVGEGEETKRSVMPATLTARGAQKARVERALSVVGFAELPDFGGSLADWASGFEHCTIQGLDRISPEDNALCHRFKHGLGPVNSNHFPPQARRVFEHYHSLAKEQMRECKRIEDAALSWSFAARSQTTIDEVLEECEMHALILENVGLHYLEDLFSSGHMWERWGAPTLSDVEHRDYFATGILSGAIHGWRFIVEGLVGRDPATNPLQPVPLPSGTFDFLLQDPICAPVPGASSYRALETDDADTLHRGVGDEYVDPCLQYFKTPLPTLFTSDGGPAAEFPETSGSQARCVAAAIREVYDLGPKRKGDLAFPAYVRSTDSGLLSTDFCFERRATNLTMFRGLGLGSKSIPPSAVATLKIVADIASGSASAFGYSGEAHEINGFRDALVRTHAAFYAAQHRNQSGLESAKLRYPKSGVFGLERNSDYEAEAVPSHADATPVDSWSHEPLGSCSSDADCGAAICNSETGACEAKEAATLRLFNRAHVGHWCAETRNEDLESLRTDCRAEERLCELCVEIVRRHVRNACDAAEFSELPEGQRVEGVCAIADLSARAPFVHAGWLESCDTFPSAEAAADAWCRRQESELAPGTTHSAVSAGGLEPPALRVGERLTLETRMAFSSGAPIPNVVIRWKVVEDSDATGPCAGSGYVVRRTDSTGVSSFVYSAAPQPRVERVIACPSLGDGSLPCDRCDPRTLTFRVRTIPVNQPAIFKTGGDAQTGGLGQLLPVPLGVEVVPEVPDGTELRFELLDGSLPASNRGGLDTAGTSVVVKATAASRASVRLSLPTVAGEYRVRVTGVDAALFPDPATSAVEFSETASEPRGDLTFSIRHNGASVSPVDLEVRVDDGSAITSHSVHSETDGAPVTVASFAPIGARTEVTISGTNRHGVIFTNRDPIVIESVAARNSRPFAELMRADRGHVELTLSAGTAPVDRSLILFDRYVPWPPVAFPGAPATVSVASPVSFNVPFQTYLRSDGSPERRRLLDVYGYSPGNQGAPFSTTLATTEDSYLARFTAPVLAARAHPENPSQAFVQLVAVGTFMPPATFPLKVLTPSGTLLAGFDAIHTASPYWWNVPSTDPLLTTVAPDDEGVMVFAANGLEFPESPDGLLFFVIDPPTSGAVILRSSCQHDRGRVQRRVSTRRCTTTSECRTPIAWSVTSDYAICGSTGFCEDFDSVVMAQTDAHCAGHGAPVTITNCTVYPDGCGPGQRCVAGVCE
ncbi:MAG: hypothetical protein HYV07_23205 [Deltaproteobacteria bacterium]|nr:hypothetical protein [Deltaproteobacteria bacterium]